MQQHSILDTKQDLTDLFLPYNISLKLKELGFDERCFANYSNPDSLDLYDIMGFQTNKIFHRIVKAPLLQQATDWLDRTYQIRVETFTSQVVGKYCVQLFTRSDKDGVIWDRTPLIGKSGFTRTEAIINGINESLKLINS